MKKIFLLIFLSIFLVSLVSASFPKSHIGHVLNGFDEINSAITTKCRPYINIVLDGDNAADVGVLHYGSTNNKLLGAYIYPHTRAGFQTCLREAGADLEKYCFCIGQGLHIVEDAWSHLEKGYTEQCLKSYLGSNYFAHMSCERNFENKLVSKWTNENKKLISDGTLTYYDGIYLDSLFDETGGNSELLNLMSDVAGVDITTDAQLIRSGYQGDGFYNTVYKDKLSLPLWAWGICIGLVVIGLLGIILMFAFGNSWWKWVNIAQYLVLILIGIIIFYSLFSGTTWKITNFIVETPQIVGMYSISISDINYYDTQIQKSVNDFLSTGNLRFDDVSGLSYVDREGKQVSGALTKAESGFKILWYVVIIPIYFLTNAFFIYKAIKKKKQK